MICLVNTRTWQLTNNATIPRATPGLAIDVGEVLCLLALGRELLTALLRTLLLPVDLARCLPFGLALESRLGVLIIREFIDLCSCFPWHLRLEFVSSICCREFGLHCVIHALVRKSVPLFVLHPMFCGVYQSVALENLGLLS